MSIAPFVLAKSTPPVKPKAPIGVVLCNLGSPESYYPSGIRKFLAEFLADRRVIETPPKWLWLFVLHFILLRLRPKKLVYRYQQIWRDGGSPLTVITKQQAAKLAQLLMTKPTGNNSYIVDYAFRYGSENVAKSLHRLQQQGIKQIIILPLYPQYSATTTASTYDSIYLWGLRQRNIPEIRMVRSFAAHPLYIEALAEKVTNYWQQNERADVLVLSFHGLPQTYIQRGDPYVAECLMTYEALKQRLELTDQQCLMTFQSRFGPSEWTKPYTIDVAAKLAVQGKTVDVMAPAFLADCLETLDEITKEIGLVYRQQGGKRYRYIPCLNEDDSLIALLANLIEQQAMGW